MEYRTKATVKIIAGLTKKEAFELFHLVGVIEEKFKENGIGLGLQSLDRETTVTFVNDTIDEWIKAGELEVLPYLNDSFRSFIELMVSERAQLDELRFEYNRALCPLLQYDLFEVGKKTADTKQVLKDISHTRFKTASPSDFLDYIFNYYLPETRTRTDEAAERFLKELASILDDDRKTAKETELPVAVPADGHVQK